MIIVYTGKGKGKTSACVGQAARALGQGLRVAFGQFMKRDGQAGEQKILRELLAPSRFLAGGEGFFRREEDRPIHRAAARNALAGPAEREQRRFRRLRDMAVALEDGVERLEKVVALTGATSGAMEKARVARDGILPAMTECRAQADKLEAMADDDLWKLPRYAELLWIH